MPRHIETRLVPHAPHQIYDLVADVERYPEFLPWCVGARVRDQSETSLLADLAIGIKMVRERYTSRVHLGDGEIRIEYVDGPFRYLTNHWWFEPVLGGTQVRFEIDFEFKSKILQTLATGLFTEVVKRMVAAFEARADALYGRGGPS